MSFASSLRQSRLPYLVALATVVTSLGAARVDAQVRPTPRDTVRRDTTTRARPTVPAPDTILPVPIAAADTTPVRAPRRPRGAGATLIRPPVSARRALLYSLALPGYGQSRLDRHATGAFFVAVEAAALAMVAKSSFDLADARAFRGDSLVATSYPVDPNTGQPLTVPSTALVRNQFSNALVRSRRLHLEDWLATLAFNHLIAGAEAFVSANLWEVQSQISARPSDHGATLAVSLTW